MSNMTGRTLYLKNTPLAEARASWTQALQEIGFAATVCPEVIKVTGSLGRITAEPVFAAHSAPAHNASAMDGIAVRFHELAGASEAAPVVLAPEQYQPVNTGNALPKGFNAVVMIEDVHELADGSVQLRAPATPWQHVRTIGEDIVATEMVLAAGQHIRPIDIGAMLATGITAVSVVRRPQVAVIPTGSELIAPGTAPAPGEIIEFNSHMFAAELTQWGAQVVRSDAVEDDPEKIRNALQTAVSENDIVLINAGASTGTKDFSARIISELGRIIVHGVAIKPGKPVILAIIDNTPVIGLPGYPISALLTMRLFVRDMISAFVGREPQAEETVSATLSRPVHSAMGVDQFIRITLGRVGDTLMATPSGKGAGAVMSLARADALLTIPAGSEGAGAGEKVEVALLRKKTEVDATLVSIGSHDNLLDLLANLLHKHRPPVRLSSAHVGSLGGIMAIRRGEAHIAGTHLPDEVSGEYNISYIKRFLSGLPLRLINLCYRQQGLIVARGNPLEITGFADIAARGLHFINRQRGAGTRFLTDRILREQGISTERILGYTREEYTHMNVAAAVAGGSCDCGMGIRAAANALQLDFIPLAEERYDLLVPERFFHSKKIEALLEIMNTSSEFKEKALQAGGYDLRHCGRILYRQ